MNPTTNSMWAEQDRHPGDRHRLFAAVQRTTMATNVLYPGSFVDVAASFVFDDVTYIDMDLRARKFFEDGAGVGELIAEHRDGTAAWRFIHADYTADVGLVDGSFDLLVSLYAGLVSEACSRYLRPGGWLLANPSHGDVAMADLNPVFQLAGVVTSRSGDYRVRTDDLAGYLIPKNGVEATKEAIRASGRGVAYTKSPFAYLFRKLG